MAARPARKLESKKPTIDAWSYSRISTYELCPRRAKFQYIDRLPTKTSASMERGSRIHKQAEDFLLDKADLPDTKMWRAWREWMEWIKSIGYMAEEDIAFTKDWERCAWMAPNVWLRMRIDANGDPQDNAENPIECAEVEAIDYKTGFPYPTHGEQAELYAIGVYLKSGRKAARVRSSFWYLDQRDGAPEQGDDHYFDADEIEELMVKWEVRSGVMTSDTEFVPNPGKSSCGKFSGCDFAHDKGGPCVYNTNGLMGKGCM